DDWILSRCPSLSSDKTSDDWALSRCSDKASDDWTLLRHSSLSLNKAT
ncbi:432_t:CDS:1, partial [Scutellospora calospora]